jgi:hypothetical protein
MSTKTLRKRIALVAVSAMGFGLLSAAPSSAAVTAVTLAGPLRAGGAAVAVNATGTSAFLDTTATTDLNVSNGAGNRWRYVNVTAPTGATTTFTADTTDETLTATASLIGTMGIYTQVLDNEIDDVGLLLQKAAGF